MVNSNAIGIDLGTSHASVAVFRHGQVEIIPNENGSLRTPACVAFTASGLLIGEDAVRHGDTNPQDIVFDVHRFIDVKMDLKEEIDDANSKTWPFKVVSSDDGRSLVQVESDGELKRYAPVQILALIIAKMKKIAQDFIGSPVKNAVISVPGMYNGAQREAVKNAAAIAGLYTLRLQTDTSLALLAYDLATPKIRGDGERTVLIVDLGAGTATASVVTIEDGIYEIRSVDGNSRLGGADFTAALVDHFVHDLEKSYGKVVSDGRALYRLRTECEQAKTTLTTHGQASVKVSDIWEGIHFQENICRSKFEEICENLFRRTVDAVMRAFRRSNYKQQLDDIILLGGSSRIPKIQQQLSACFHGKELGTSLLTEEMVACGAAVQAAILTGNRSDIIQDLLLLDVCSYSLGVETAGGLMTALIKRNTTIPTKTSTTVNIKSNEQSNVVVKIIEGERAMAKDNRLITQIEVSAVQPNFLNNKIEVTFDIDANGILNVTARDVVGGAQNKKNERNNTEDDDLRRMCNEHSNIFSELIDSQTFEGAQKQKYDRIRALETEIELLKATQAALQEDNKNLKNTLEDVTRKYTKLLVVAGRNTP